MIKKILYLIPLAVVLILSSCKYLQIGPKGEGEFVFAESLVPYNDVDVNAMKKDGVSAAQKNAVKRVADVFVSSSTTVDHNAVVQNDILPKSDTFIRKYYVMKTYRKGDQWFTQIKALVLVTDISDIIKQSDESALVKKTNVWVASREIINGEVSLAQDCKQAVYKAMKNAPFSLINGDNLSDNNIEDPVPVVDKARNDGARFIIISDVSAAPLSILGTVATPFKTYRASVNMKVLSTRNYGVVGNSAAQASGLDPDEGAAAQKSIAAACEAAAKDLLDPLQAAVNSAKTYTLRVTDVNTIDRLKSLLGILKDLREVEDFNLVKYNNSAADFEVQANIKTSDELAAKIIRQYNENFTVTNITTKNIELKFM